MNYEELLAAKNDGKLNLTLLPIGEYYRTQVDGKYRGLVDIRMDLHRNLVFTKALLKECEENKTLAATTSCTSNQQRRRRKSASWSLKPALLCLSSNC